MTTNTNGRLLRTAAVLIAALALCGGFLTACSSDDGGSHSGAGHTHGSAADQSAQVALTSTMRTLWAQHMEWTYATVVAFASESPGLEPTLNRLLQNQKDIGDAVATYYGADAGTALTDLLNVHIQDAVPVLTAAKAGDTEALKTAVDEWYANAQDIGDFLATANPAWKQADMRDMMKGHITQTIGYASDVLGAKYDAALTKYNEAEAHMTEMADMLSAGIIAQHPEKF